MQSVNQFVQQYGLLEYASVIDGVSHLAERMLGPNCDRTPDLMAAQFALDLKAAGLHEGFLPLAHDLMETVLTGGAMSRDDGVFLYGMIALWVANNQPVMG